MMERAKIRKKAVKILGEWSKDFAQVNDDEMVGWLSGMSLVASGRIPKVSMCESNILLMNSLVGGKLGSNAVSRLFMSKEVADQMEREAKFLSKHFELLFGRPFLL
ncbi:hypothetical protein LRP52_48500 [Photobacterium sp. ZSDE20]|nr:hypothetical protein [Photobacterium sp. ZSDE20]